MNRRIRFRTYGGVRGRERKSSLLRDFAIVDLSGFDAEIDLKTFKVGY